MGNGEAGLKPGDMKEGDLLHLVFMQIGMIRRRGGGVEEQKGERGDAARSEVLEKLGESSHRREEMAFTRFDIS